MNSYFKKAVIIFLSKVILRKLNEDEVPLFRKSEKICKNYIKVKADVKS